MPFAELISFHFYIIVFVCFHQNLLADGLYS